MATSKQGNLLVSNESTLVEKIYFNTELSNEQVDEILNNLTHDFENSSYIVLFTQDYGMLEIKKDTSINQYMIGYQNEGAGVVFPVYISEFYVASGISPYPDYSSVDFIGWNPSLQNPFEVNSYGFSTMEGIGDFGTENNLLTNLFSMNVDFTSNEIEEPEEVEPITDLPKFLEANADAIRYAKGTSEKINAQDFVYEIKKLKKISVEPLSITQNGTYTAPEGSAYSPVEVNVPSESTLKKLLDYTKSCYDMFYSNTTITDLTGYISFDDTHNVTNMSGMFASCSNLQVIPLLDTRNVTNMSNMFTDCRSLQAIPPLDVSNVTNMSNMFTYCKNLKSILMYGMKVSFSISASTQFEQEDLVTILNNLATVTTAQTLTMGSTNLAKLTDEDKEIAIAKGWTLA